MGRDAAVGDVAGCPAGGIQRDKAPGSVTADIQSFGVVAVVEEDVESTRKRSEGICWIENFVAAAVDGRRWIGCVAGAKLVTECWQYRLVQS